VESQRPEQTLNLLHSLLLSVVGGEELTTTTLLLNQQTTLAETVDPAEVAEVPTSQRTLTMVGEQGSQAKARGVEGRTETAQTVERAAVAAEPLSLEEMQPHRLLALEVTELQVTAHGVPQHLPVQVVLMAGAEAEVAAQALKPVALADQGAALKAATQQASALTDWTPVAVAVVAADGTFLLEMAAAE